MTNSSSLVEHIDRELGAKTGIFFNLKTKSAWELHIQDGELIVKVPNFNFQISPSSKTRFRPVNTSIDLEIEFEKQSAYRYLYAQSMQKG